VTIPTGSLAKLEFSSGLLTNSGDSLSLETATGEVIMTAKIPACAEKGVSFIFDGTEWIETLAGQNSEITGDYYQQSNSASIGNNLVQDSGGTIKNGTKMATMRLTIPTLGQSNFERASDAAQLIATDSTLPYGARPKENQHKSVIIIGIAAVLLGGSSGAYLFYVKKTPLFPERKHTRNAWEEQADDRDVL
jgi:hypothetical protein